MHNLVYEGEIKILKEKGMELKIFLNMNMKVISMMIKEMDKEHYHI